MDLNNYWQAVLRQDADALRKFFHPEAYVRWHNTNEHFTADEFIRVNCEYPGRWEGEVERIEEWGETVITAAHVYALDEPLSFHVVSFLKIKDGRILAIDEYWGDDGQPPQWRRKKQIGKAIK